MLWWSSTRLLSCLLIKCFCLQQETASSTPKSDFSLHELVTFSRHIVFHIRNQWHNRLALAGPVQGHGFTAPLFPTLFYRLDECRGLQLVSRPSKSVWYDTYFTKWIHVQSWRCGMEWVKFVSKTLTFVFAFFMLIHWRLSHSFH